MDLRIGTGEKEKGKISYEALPVFQYFFRELGFDVDLNTVNQSVQLSSVLTKKKIVISSDEKEMPHSFRKPHLERNVLKQIQKFLEASGAEVYLMNQKESREDADLHFKFSLLEVPNIKEPLLELTDFSKFNFHKLVELMQSECKKMNIKFKMNELSRNYDPTLLKVQIMSPVIPSDEFWNRYGENYAITITTGIYARLLGSSPLSFFSCIPVENLLSLFGPTPHTEFLHESPQKLDQTASKENTALEKTEENKTKEAAVFFDYHMLIDEDENQKIQLLGNLHIKNIGTEILHNPVICIRSTSSKGLKIIGQILPKNFAQTKGVLNQEGAKGWRYMNENWLDEFDEKGEIWICTIRSTSILPRQTESLSNLQIILLDPDQKTIRVEAYVFFVEDSLEFKSSNQISLSLLKKVKSSNGEKKD